MVCSDGLTSMVREPKLKPLLVGNDRPLDELGRELIAAANAAGGRDNITVILFTLEEVDAPAGHCRAASAPRARHHRRRHERVRHVRGRGGVDPAPGREPAAGPHAPRRRGARPRRRQRLRRGRGRVPRVRHRRALRRAPARAADRGGPGARAAAAEPPRKRRRRIVTPGRLLALGCVIGLLAAFWLATRQVYFVGVDESRGNVVTLYHGLPYDLPLGHPAVLAGPPLRRDVRATCPRTAARRSPITRCARRTTPRAWSWRSSRDAFSERAQPRAAGADPGVAAADRRVRRDLHPALGDPLRRLADLRRDLPRAVLRRATW